MQGFFDFLGAIDPYVGDAAGVQRLNRRHEMFVAPYAAEIKGDRVLDLGAHDGRWAHAFAAAGAREVVGIEGRAELIARYDHFPDAAVKSRVTLTQGDIFDGLDARVKAGETFDIIAVLGVFYHIMDHHRLLRLCAALKPGMVIIDSEFAIRPGPVITLVREDTSNPLNAIEQMAGQSSALVGIPSFRAVDAMADVLGFQTEWLDWDSLPKEARGSVGDYYRPNGKKRGTVVLRPREAGAHKD